MLILTCTGVSFAHGSNDGQKGMGLIMLILIGTVPTAYALNRALPDSSVAQFRQASQAASEVVAQKAAGYSVVTAASADEAVAALLSNGRIDVVVCDLEMPGRSGFDLVATHVAALMEASPCRPHAGMIRHPAAVDAAAPGVV